MPTSSSMSNFKSASLAVLSTLALIRSTSAHSWIEEFQVIDSNGSYIGDRGYPRGYMARTDPGYNGFSMDYLVPQSGVRITSTDALCHPAQRTSNYTNPAYPKLQVTPGSYVAMKYLENGHVTLPWNQLGKPAGGGTVFVYGTTQPSDNEQIADVLNWSTDGTGGNGKGFLMAAQNFDDGRCHQINCGNISIARQTLFPAHVANQPSSSVEQWCETDLKIPTTVKPGSLSVYWIWQWPTEPGHDCTLPEGKDEYYTTCSDFEVIANSGNDADAAIVAETKLTNTLAQENPQSTAVSNFKSRVAFTASPAVIMVSGTSTIGQSTTAASTFLAACSANGNANAKPNVNFPTSCPAITDFGGAASSSAAAAIKQYATTIGIAPAVVSTGTPSAAPSTSYPASASMTSSAASSTTAASSTQSAASSGPATVTLTLTTTVYTASSSAASTTPASTSSSATSSYSAPASTPSSPSSSASPSAATGLIVFPTISTVAGSSPSIAPVADVVDGNNHVLSEHVPRNLHRTHPRQMR